MSERCPQKYGCDYTEKYPVKFTGNKNKKTAAVLVRSVEKKNHGDSVSVTTVWHIGACIFYYLKLNIQLYDIKLPSLLELKI